MNVDVGEGNDMWVFPIRDLVIWRKNQILTLSSCGILTNVFNLLKLQFQKLENGNIRIIK